jgi:hypothetical protein
MLLPENLWGKKEFADFVYILNMILDWNVGLNKA